MHPALSVIFFTVASGIGYGMLFLLGTTLVIQPDAFGRGAALVALVTGALFAAAGLTSSMLHLGQPQRAWRAFSQWRSSWLSREGVAAMASFAPMLALAWSLWRDADAAALRTLGALLAVCAAITVLCTAKIYTSLKTIPVWHNGHVLPGYLLLGLLGGACWLWLIAAFAAAPMSRFVLGLIAALAVAASALKLRYWRSIDAPARESTPESATGLARFGAVRSVEAPHTEQNYLTQEMGFVLARKHAQRLRRLSLMLLGPATVILVLLAWFATTALADGLCAAAVVLLVTSGLFVERWLFFAEAKHVVMLYYARSA
jgi:DMSO reductase anchor subunit